MSDDVLVIMPRDELQYWMDGSNEVLSRRAEQTGSIIDPQAEGFPPPELVNLVAHYTARAYATFNMLLDEVEAQEYADGHEASEDFQTQARAAIKSVMEWAVGRWGGGARSQRRREGGRAMSDEPREHEATCAVVTRPTRRIPDWLVMGPAPHFATCQRCGKPLAKPELPMPIDALVPYLEYAALRHAHCKVGDAAGRVGGDS